MPVCQVWVFLEMHLVSLLANINIISIIDTQNRTNNLLFPYFESIVARRLILLQVRWINHWINYKIRVSIKQTRTIFNELFAFLNLALYYPIHKTSFINSCINHSLNFLIPPRSLLFLIVDSLKNSSFQILFFFLNTQKKIRGIWKRLSNICVK